MIKQTYRPRAANWLNEMVLTAAQLFAVPVDVMLAAGVVCHLPGDVVVILKNQNVIDENNNVIVDGGVVKVEATQNVFALIIINKYNISHEFNGKAAF